MKYMDASRPMPTLADVTTEKVYPRFTVDLDQFKDLAADVDEGVELTLRGRVCSRNHTDYCNTMEIEVQAIGVPSAADFNEADRALAKLKGR